MGCDDAPFLQNKDFNMMSISRNFVTKAEKYIHCSGLKIRSHLNIHSIELQDNIL